MRYIGLPLTLSAADHPIIYAALKRPEWWLVVAALLTLCAIAYQAREMRRATAAMSKSTDAVNRQAEIMERQTVAIERER
jgi:hypothetical protein